LLTRDKCVIVQVLAALGLPPELASQFPKRTETVRAAVSDDATRQGLERMYTGLIEEIRRNPAVVVV